MPVTEAGRKALPLAAIAAVIGASAWLRPSVAPMAALLPAHIGTRAALPPGVQSPVQSRFRVDSEPVQSRFRVKFGVKFRVDSEQDQSRIRVSSELVASRPASAPARQELRTSPARTTVEVGTAPSVAASRFVPPSDRHVSRAFVAAGRHTAGAFRTASRALRSVF